jgi:AcrR family transcriptional regulator
MTHQERSEQTRLRILTAARECFARAGYDATGVAEICQRAGVSKGAFYHHFPSKQAVFLALLDRWLAGLEVPMAASRAAAIDVPAQLLAMAGMAEQVFQEAKGQFPMFLQFWAQAARDPQVWQATIMPYQRYRALFADMVRTGIAEGSLRPSDPDTAARVIVALAVGLVLQGVLDPDGADWGEVVREGITMLLRGLLAEPQQVAGLA